MSDKMYNEGFDKMYNEGFDKCNFYSKNKKKKTKLIGAFLREEWIENCSVCLENINRHDQINLKFPHKWTPNKNLLRHRSEYLPYELAPLYSDGCSFIN